ncbi:MAG: hypothetical protein CVU38_20960, partial [Chloroflexi bacterium HGW-Chloroflexi-1]
PALGRFIQADSIVPQPGNPQALNRYSYVLGNPLRYTDPTGHQAWVQSIRFPGQSLVGALAIGAEAIDPMPFDPVVIPFGVMLIANDPLWQIYGPQLPALFDKAVEAGHSLGRALQGGNTADPGGLGPNDPWRWGTNYRANYESYYGAARDPNYQVHHVLPKQWRDVLAKVNLNVDDPRWLREIQAVPGDENIHARFFTTRWGEFANNLQGRTPKPQEIIRFAQELEQEYFSKFGTTLYRQGEGLPGWIDWNALWAQVNAALQGGGS